MKLTDFIKIKARNEQNPFGDFCSDILRDPKFPFESDIKDQLSYLKSIGVPNGLSDQFNNLKQEFENYILDPDYEKNHDFSPIVGKEYDFKSGEWVKVGTDLKFDLVLLFKGDKEYYKAYLIDRSKNQALFLELNTIAKRPNPRVVDFEKVEQFGNGEHHTINEALTIFQRLESSSFVKNKFLIQKALELLKPLNH